MPWPSPVLNASAHDGGRLTIVDRPPQSWVEALSTGLGQGIEQLAQRKLQELAEQKQRAQTRSGLDALFPHLSVQQKDQLSMLPEPLIKEYQKQESNRAQEEAMARALGLGNEQQAPGVEGAQQGMQQAGPQPRLSAENALKVQELQLKKQKVIDQENNPIIEPIRAAYKPSLELRKALQEALDLVESGKVAESTSGRLQAASGLYATDESQRYDNLISQVINLKGQVEKGMPSKHRLQLIEKGKAGLNQSNVNKVKSLKQGIEEIQENIDQYEALKNTIDKFNGVSPKNIEKYIDEGVKELKNKRTKVDPIIEKLNKLVESGKYKVGAVINHKASGKKFKVTPEGVVEVEGA